MKNLTLNSWRQAKRRCEDPKCKDYTRYGGRGIRFLIPSWQALEAAIGPRQEGYTLDRIDSNGNYEIGNVCWSDATTQSRNRRNVKCSEEKAAEIRELYRRGWYSDDIAKRTGLNEHTVIAVIQGKQWR